MLATRVLEYLARYILFSRYLLAVEIRKKESTLKFYFHFRAYQRKVTKNCVFSPNISAFYSCIYYFKPALTTESKWKTISLCSDQESLFGKVSWGTWMRNWSVLIFRGKNVGNSNSKRAVVNYIWERNERKNVNWSKCFMVQQYFLKWCHCPTKNLVLIGSWPIILSP